MAPQVLDLGGGSVSSDAARFCEALGEPFGLVVEGTGLDVGEMLDERH